MESHYLGQHIQQALYEAIPALGETVVQFEPSYKHQPQTQSQQIETNGINQSINEILPPRYQNQTPSAAPMGAASLKYDDGNAAWNEIWTDFCNLTLAGGPSHRGVLLEPSDPEIIR